MTLFLMGCILGVAFMWFFILFNRLTLSQLKAKCIERNEIARKELLEKAKKEGEHFLCEVRKTLAEEKIQSTAEKKRIQEELLAIEREKGALQEKELRIHLLEKQSKELIQQGEKTLETYASLTKEEAKIQLTQKIEGEVAANLARWVRQQKIEAEDTAEQYAQKIVINAIQKIAVPCVHEVTLSHVPLPNKEMKGRLIGREGKNIQTLERETGVSLLVDESPGFVVLSAFDPIRLEIARVAVEKLVLDGRIHPTRIVEVVDWATQEVKKTALDAGKSAAERTGQTGLSKEILTLLGNLKYRHSYGQNVLYHSIEVSHLMGLMAAELHLDISLAKRIGLLHDIGKAVTHEKEGTHTQIGYDLLIQNGESEAVANGVLCHHSETKPSTMEAALCASADAISASRKGARREALEEYIRRMRSLEKVANQMEGIEKAYVLQAGREVRVLVNPDKIDDGKALILAQELSKKIESSLNYPGKIKITLIREKQVIEWAN